MSKIIIYDDKNFLIGKLDGKVEKKTDKTKENTEFIAHFSKYKIVNSVSLKKQLKKIEDIFKYHRKKQ